MTSKWISGFAASVLALLSWCVTIPQPVSAECSVCDLKITHRTGSIKIILATITRDGTSTTYGTTGAIPIRLQITNLGESSMQIPTRATSKSFSIHIVSDAYKATEKDRPVLTDRPANLGAHKTFTFPVSDLRDWQWGPEQPGIYHVNFSYDGVDSNEVTIVVVDK